MVSQKGVEGISQAQKIGSITETALGLSQQSSLAQGLGIGDPHPLGVNLDDAALAQIGQCA